VYAITAKPTSEIGIVRVIILDPNKREIGFATTRRRNFRSVTKGIVTVAQRYYPEDPIGVLIEGKVVITDASSIIDVLETWFLSQYGYRPSEAELQIHPDPNDSFWNPEDDNPFYIEHEIGY
jgi:hypothetical protein